MIYNIIFPMTSSSEALITTAIVATDLIMTLPQRILVTALDPVNTATRAEVRVTTTGMARRTLRI